jgi:signal transduction histidine kinase
LSASIAHEINNPLEAVTNLLYLAQHTDDLDDIHEHLSLAERELRRVAAITSQTLRFHKQSTSPQEITPAQLVESALTIFQGRLANTSIRIYERMRADRSIRCFEGEIRQVISNLIGNALDALSSNPASKAGRILIRSRESCDWKTGDKGIAITVADNGSGMSSQTLAKLFAPFFTTKGVTGTGLGLWVSKEIITRHRGALRVRSSQSPTNHGTVFTLFLPFEAATR